MNKIAELLKKLNSIYLKKYEGKLFVLLLTGISDNSYAVMLLNRGNKKQKMIARWNEIGLPEGEALVRDIWKRKDLGIFNNYFDALVLLDISPVS